MSENAIPNLPVWMDLDDLRRVPEVPLPPDFRIREFRDGDADRWFEVVVGAERWFDLKPDLFAKTFAEDPPAVVGRLLFLVAPDGRDIGTVTAWFMGDDPSMGRIHWLALSPGWQGRGLGLALLAAGCARLRDRGHAAACLATQTGRVPALNLYLRCGFLPRLRTPEDCAAWADVRPRLKYPFPMPERG